MVWSISSESSGRLHWPSVFETCRISAAQFLHAGVPLPGRPDRAGIAVIAFTKPDIKRSFLFGGYAVSFSVQVWPSTRKITVKFSTDRKGTITMRIGYARVSTQDQKPELQLDALAAAGCEQTFQEKASGKDAGRAELEACLRTLRKGDTLVVWRLDRLGRSLKNLVEIVHALEARGIGFQSLMENVDTTNAGGRLIFHIFGALAEFERNLIREPTLTPTVARQRERESSGQSGRGEARLRRSGPRTPGCAQ